ncbi:hypothetical protein GY45DRAFT_1348298 [Cubamyces sp. BRFM 1775]|nr:hypothetical protein GY45DRAFT_1348298 [Cubamyces sp. BRFM 1775]
MFTAFNILQWRAVLLNISLKVKKEHFCLFAFRFDLVSSEAVASVCARIVETGLVCTETEEEGKVVQLMKKVQLIRGLMASKGMPSFYITINPADIYNPIVKLMASSDIDVDNLLPEEVPDPWEQAILIALNPVVAAQCFNVYMKAFIRDNG